MRIQTNKFSSLLTYLLQIINKNNSMKNIKIIPLIICIGLLAFLFFAPSILVSGVKKNVYTIKEEQKTSGYQGIVRIWHVVSWRTGRGAGVTHLKKCATAFEKNNLNLFIEIEGMTPMEAKDRMAKGEKPDLISYPNGFFENVYGLEKLDVDQSLVLHNLVKSGMSGTGVYGAPYMYGGYMLFVNSEMIYEKDLDNFDETGIPNYALNACLKALSFTEKRGNVETTVNSIGFDEKALIPEAGLSYHMPPFDWNEDAADPLMIVPEDNDNSKPSNNLYGKCDVGGGYDAFISETTAMLVGTQDTYSRLSNLSDQGKGPEYMPVALSPFTDMVQYFSILETEDALKKSSLNKLIMFLQSVYCQKKLENLYVFPVIQIENLYAEDYLYQSLYNIQIAGLKTIPAYYGKDYISSIKNIMESEFKQNKNTE